MKFSIAIAVIGISVLMLSQPFSAYSQSASRIGHSKDPATLKAGVSFVWLAENDSQGLMFSNSFNHYLGNRLAVGLNLGMLSAKRFDNSKQIYTVQNTFYMGSAEVTFDLMQSESVLFRIGGGPTARHRAEINSSLENVGTQDGSVTHVKTSEAGVVGFIENDFNILKNGVAGGRVGYFHYSKGTPVLSVGMHVGFKF
ncbi:hypothetical protein [Pontibacter oryzae]|uniref:Outer membrane protein beta-barrel domain-containing protein n=1 Tax=Pontibacter oryzae TaxID=2304593 RepID=A0A399SLD3_9BACT|nr:hypothetical protein [Pontibacter oryzae]RIJ42575.1 hypothetical protein D1627_01570 [Pontibacter oryzae]